MQFACAFLLLLSATAVSAETVMPTRTIRPGEIIRAGDVQISQMAVIGVVKSAQQAIGQEARVALYPGRPIRVGDIGPPALVERNQIVTLIFQQSGLTIKADGRALGRGSHGETVRVMNLTSRTTVTGYVAPDGSVWVN
jgi:flagella basal body P-ring formation protein FlgA